MLLFSFVTILMQSYAQKGAAFSWKGDTLQVSDNRLSEQGFLFRNGLLTPLYANKAGSKDRSYFSNAGPLVLVSDSGFISATQKEAYIAPTKRVSGYNELLLHAVFGKGELLYSIRVYDECPGWEWKVAMKGDIIPGFIQKIQQEQQGAIETASLLSNQLLHYFNLPLASPHYKIKATAFRAATDHNNDLIHIQDGLPYAKARFYTANVITASNAVSKATDLIVKMAPVAHAQSGYYGFDFGIQFKGISVFSTGYDTTCTLHKNQWQTSYPLYILRYAGSEAEALFYYKQYELSVHKYLYEYDNTFTMNTWGNRNRDSRINESFILKELEAAAKLGITHYQIDDGWQQGLSQNSSLKAGTLWDDWSATDWEINKTRFPGGFEKISKEAGQKNISLGLWFNPSKKNDYQNWQRDRDILSALYRKYNIKWIKIDGVEIGNKTAEESVYNMLSQASAQADNQLQFNMDVTAGKRGGYFCFNRLGNIFLENRYTDWGNFYPHLALRNAWQLSYYTPLQRYQVEWLDKWRNDKMYAANDMLKPSKVPFDYQFAITMMAQPLAWMEATTLPQEAFSVKALIDTWKKERNSMATGIIHPVGEMPDGFSFTGFVSYTKNRLYVLFFREAAGEDQYVYQLPFVKKKLTGFKKIWGDGQLQNVSGNNVTVRFPQSFRFLWGYFEMN
ncbi:MAG: alpha-galactosidase [Niabella sp.]